MTCEQFHDRLWAWMRGDLNEAQTAELLDHTAACEECATVLRLEEQLALGTADALERRVPGSLLDSVWPGVAAALPSPREASRSDSSGAVAPPHAGGAPAHFYTGGALLASGEWRGMDLLSPLWHYLDLTPQGRGDWMPQLTYD